MIFVAFPTAEEIVLCPYDYNYRICNRLQNYSFFTNPTICNLMDGYLERALALGTPEGLWPAASRPLYCSLAGDNISVLLSNDRPSGPLEPSGPPFGLLEQSLRLYLERAKRLWTGPPALWNARSANGPPQAIGTGFSLWNARSANGPPSCLNVRLPAEPLSF